jgi:hypothetical protein
VTSSEIRGGQTGTGAGFSDFPLLIIISPNDTSIIITVAKRKTASWRLREFYI